MKNIQSNYFLAKKIIIVLLGLSITSCKKPRNGEYTYEETGTKSSYLSENASPFTSLGKNNFNTSEKARLKNKSNSTLYINEVPWTINGDAVSYIYSNTSVISAGSTLKYEYSYTGTITGKKNIEGTFKRVQVNYSYSNIRIDSSSGSFTYKK